MLYILILTVASSGMKHEDDASKSMFLPVYNIESPTNDERIMTPATVEEMEKIDRMNKFFKTKQSFTIKELLRDKLLARKSPRGKDSDISKDPFPISKYGKTSSPEVMNDDLMLGKDKIFYGKETSVSPKEHSYGRYSKGRKIIDRSILYEEEEKAQPNKENENLTVEGGKIFSYDSLMAKNSKILQPSNKEETKFKPPLERNNSQNKPKNMSCFSPDSLPDLSYFLNLNISIGEPSILPSAPMSSNSITSLNLMDVDNVLENFDSDIFDELSNVNSTKSDKDNGKNIEKTLKCNSPDALSTFNMVEKWEIYEGIYKNFRQSNFADGPSFSFHYRICKCIDICERSRLVNAFPLIYKFNYFITSCDQYIAYSQKKDYMSLEDLQEKRYLDDFKQSITSLAIEYQITQMDICSRIKKIGNLYFRKIKNILEIYNSINIEIQRSKFYKQFLPELSVIEIILIRKNVKAKGTLLKTYGLLIIINHLARCMFPDECNLSKMILKYKENNGKYILYSEKIYFCYQNIVSIKGKNSPVITLLDKIGYDPTLRYIDLFTPILLTLDIIHPHTGMNIVKLITHMFCREENFLATLIQDRYISLEIILSLSLVLFNDTLNHQLDADEGLLIWFRSYIETFGSQLNFIDIIDCLRYMAGEVVVA